MSYFHHLFGKGLLILILLLDLSVFAKGMKRSEFEKYKNQDLTEFMDSGEKAYERRIGPPISRDFYRGANLVYHCTKRHFACVSDLNFEECAQKQEQERAEKKNMYSCVPLKSYQTQQKCFENQMKAVHQVVNRGFCLLKGN